MSLTWHIDQPESPVAQFFAEWFPNIEQPAADVRQALSGATTIRPANSKSVPWWLLGHAVDFRLRGYWEPVSFSGLPEVGLQRAWGLAGWTFRETEGLELEERARALGSVGKKLDSADEVWLARFCLALGYFESVGRGGALPAEIASLNPEAVTARDLLALPTQIWADDISRQSWAFYDRHADLLTQRAVLNPTFDGSADVGGADADLVLGDCLLDIKATISPKLQRKWLYQLLGYVLLDYSDSLGMREVGIYFSRQAILVRWSLDKLLPPMATDIKPSLADLRTEFEKSAKLAGKAVRRLLAQ